MRSIPSIAFSLCALGGLAIASSQRGAAPVPAFKSAELVSASEVTIPFNSVANGIVLVNAVIGKTGKVEDVEVVRALASVTEGAIAAVKKWEFTPGTLDGKPAVTRLVVAIVFCPSMLSPDGSIKLPPLDSQQGKDSSDKLALLPPTIVAAEYPRDQKILGGTVVLQAAVDFEGGLEYAKVVKDVPGLTASALLSVNEKWKFGPALLEGKPVGSRLAIAFAFRPATPMGLASTNNGLPFRASTLCLE